MTLRHHRVPSPIAQLLLPALTCLSLACPAPQDEDPDTGGSTGADSGESSVGTVTDSGEIPNGCDAPTGPGTDVPNAITADETWTLEGSPYRVPVNVYLTASITMEACTVVQLAPGVRFLVGNDPAPGAVIARGESIGGVLRPVRFEALDPAAPWATIEVDRTGTLDLEHTQIEGGGGNDVPGMISAWGVDPEAEATPNVRMVDVTLEGSASVGVHLQSRAAFTDDSSGVSIHGSASYPVWIEAGAVHSLPQDLTVGDNADDVVYIDPFTSIDDDTFPDRGVPLRLGEVLYLGVVDGGLATLTIEPGVELQFATGAGSGIIVGLDDMNQGQIVAQGTADAPILLHAAQADAAPGSWMGLYFRYSPSSGNVMSYVTVADAGGESGAQGFGCGPADNNASILLLTANAPSPFLDHVSIENAGGDTQLLLGWSEEADPSGVAQSFFDGNSFADAPACRVSLPRDTTNGCPGGPEPDCL
jgi:hypothetical protein